MTAAGYYGDGESPHMTLKERWRQIAGHGWIGFYCFWLACVIAGEYITDWKSWVITSVLILGIVLMNIGDYGHMRNLCWRCMKIVPLNPEVKVKKHDRALRTLHWCTDHSFKMIISVIAVFFLPLVIIDMLTPILLGHPLTPPWPTIGYLGIFSVQITLAYSGNRHQWLRPWCPYCKRWDDGGSHEVAPDPVPSGENDRDLVA